MSNKEYAIIFDCDGTVLDTYQLIIETVYQTFAKMLPNYPLTYEEADAFFGPLLDDTFGKYAKDKKQLNELIECYRVINNNLMEKYIKAFPGILDLLKDLKMRNYKISIVSIMIGDTIIDIDTGNNAKIKTIGVTWCRTKQEEFLRHHASYVVDTPKEILKIIEEL